MATDQEVLQIYEAGELTVIGFAGQEVLDPVNIAEWREQINDIIEEFGCRVIAFDLTGVKLIPSGLLGLLGSLHQSGIELHLYNPSADVRDVLEITNINEFVQVHDIEF